MKSIPPSKHPLTAGAHILPTEGAVRQDEGMNASEYLTADLEKRRGNPVVRGFRTLVNVVVAASGGGGDLLADVDLVVRRRDTGREILRTAADVGEPELLLHTVRRDLETKTVEEFVAEWRLPDGGYEK
jgi:hypothetical protein